MLLRFLGRLARLSLLALSLALAAPLGAQPFPAKPLRLVLPFPPGGPTDLLGRMIAQRLSEQLGQQVVADNRPGAGGNVGLEITAKSPSDGYTIALTSPLIAISPSLYAKLNYDPFTDLAPIALVAVIQNVMLVHPNVPAKTLREFVAVARNRPGKVNFGSGGVGTTSHLAPELFRSLAKLNIVHVPYKGTGQALVGLLGGEIDMLVMAAPAAASQIKAGKVRALAVLSERRLDILPEVLTARESGMEGLEVPIWYGIVGPAGIPRDIIARLNAELVRAMNAPEMRDKLAAAGIEPRTSTVEEFAAYIRSEAARFAKVIREAGIKAE
jgi:tripartite-type tricarboxylate transporter receptor subunit TctC